MKLPEITKRAEEQFSIGFKYIAPDLEDDETLEEAEITIEPSEVGGLAKQGAEVFTGGNTVAQIVKEGIDGNEYRVNFVVTTSTGSIYKNSIFVKIRDFV